MSTASRQMVRKYLVKSVSAEPTSLWAGELASNLDSSPKAVVQQLGRLQEDIVGVSLEHWGRSKNATRHIEAIDS